MDPKQCLQTVVLRTNFLNTGILTGMCGLKKCLGAEVEEVSWLPDDYRQTL